MKNIGLYLHIPFCKSKCPYCDFYSLNPKKYDVNEYVAKLTETAEAYNKDNLYKADTLYFGGGTPSVLGTDNICSLTENMKKIFNFDGGEITLEINPESGRQLDFEKIRKAGVNRLSIGLQSAVNSELKLLGRLHNRELAENVVNLAKKSGFDNISLDLMLGVSAQTAESLDYSVEFCYKLDVQHISAYILKREEGTPYYENKRKLIFPDEDMQCDFYLQMCKRLNDLGYHHYEISNFAKKGFEAVHNLKYWNCENYLGIGPSAHSFIDGKRFFYPRSIEDFYKNKIIQDGSGGDEEEYSMLRLRLSDGLIYSEFEKRFNKPFPKKYIENAEKLKPYVIVTEKNIYFNDSGFLISNYLINKILYGV